MLAQLIPERLNPHLESIFAIGVDEMSWDDLDEQNYHWPSIQAVRDYRHQVRALVLKVIEHAPLQLPLNWHNPWWTIIMGIEHERIHLETSSVLIRQHQLRYVQNHPQWRANVITGIAPENSLVKVPAGQVNLHKNFEHAFMAGTMNTATIMPKLQNSKPLNIWYPIRSFSLCGSRRLSDS